MDKTNDKALSLDEEIEALSTKIKLILQDIRTGILAKDNPFNAEESRSQSGLNLAVQQGS